MRNIYLDLIDAAREVARQAADDDPIHDINGNFCDIPLVATCGTEPEGFYNRARQLANYVLNQAGQISLGPNDDMVISTFSVQNKVIINRFPQAFNDGICDQGGSKGWRNNCLHESKFTMADVQSMLDSLPSGTPPDVGLVLVELYHDHHMVLALPWITTFVPDTLTLHAYSIMPNRAATP